MDGIHVRRVAIRCRVGSSRDAEKARAQRVFRDEVGVALEEAVALVGISEAEQICIRKVQLSARLWIGLTDAALRTAWAEALAADIRRAIASGDTTNVVRYSSSVASVVDALRCLARGDMGRQWAWQQLGLATEISHGGSRAGAICALLRGRPDAIVAALRALPDEPSFWRLLASLDDEQVEAIADAALAASGCTVTIATLAATGTQDVAAIAPRAAIVAARAHIARRHSALSSLRRSTAIAALATLEVEPALLRGDARTIGFAIAAVAAIIRGTGDRQTVRHADDKPSPTPRSPEGPDAFDGHSRRADSARRIPVRRVDDARDSGEAPRISNDRNSGDLTQATSPSPDASSDIGSDAAHGASTDSRRTTRPEPPHEGADEDETGPRDCRVRGRSEWAGLLFLINVLRDGELIDPLLDDPALAHRPSQWVMHRLALTLVPSEPADAAALAFAGLAPDRLPVDFAGDLPTADEQTALLRHARACADVTRALLGAEAGGEVLYAICARAGEIVADPGWIEVQFSLDTIAIDVRRAGLDLDPGYIPWLGIVMKFAYV